MLNYRKDGSTFWNSVTLSPIFGERGLVTHIVGIQTDVTERRRLEEQMRQAQKMEAVGQLAAGVAHDFNNLLMVINGYSELLMRGLDPQIPSREYVEAIQEAGQGAGRLTRQLLTFSRRQLVEPRILDLNGVVADTERMLRRLIGEDVLLTTHLAASMWPVKMDPGQLEQVILNLAVNARDAMPRGGRLTISTRMAHFGADELRPTATLGPGDYVVLTVEDTGHGMDASVRARLFEPFFTTKAAGKGTGLGLATVHGIVQSSQGGITVESEVGRGSTFCVYLPRAMEVPDWMPATRAVTATDPATETLLVVEDEDAVRGLIRRVLKAKGYQVLEASNGRDALRVAAAHVGALDLLITDVVMPHMGGWELADQMKGLHPNCRVLFLSGYTCEDVERHGISTTEVAFLQKPFLTAALIEKVRLTLHGDGTSDGIRGNT